MSAKDGGSQSRKCKKLTEKCRRKIISIPGLQAGGTVSASACVCTDHFVNIVHVGFVCAMLQIIYVNKLFM